MTRFLWIVPVLGLLAPGLAQAASDGGDAVEQRPAVQVPTSDASVNRQILQTLTDIRDSQLSVLQAQVEILSILRAQGKAQVAAPPREAAPASGRKTAAKAHKPKASENQSAAR